MGDLGKLIVAKGFKKLPKVQKNAQSVHTDKDALKRGGEKESGNNERTIEIVVYTHGIERESMIS